MNQLQKKSEGTFRALLERHQNSIATALPRYIDAGQWTQIALTAISKNKDLLNCPPVSVFLCAMEAAQLGLTLDGALGHAYIVAYGKQAVFQIGYRGLIHLAIRSGKIEKIESKVVRSGDDFIYKYGLSPVLAHTEAKKDRGELTHVWALATFSSSTHQFEVLDRETVMKHKGASPSAGSEYSPWNKWEEWMWKKTAIRSLIKLLPVSPEVQRVLGLEDQAEAGVTQTLNIPDYIEEEATEAFLGTEAKMETLKERMQAELDQLPDDRKKDTDIGGLPLEERQDEPKPRNARKGLLSGPGIAEINKAALAADLSARQLSEIMGVHGAESIMEIKAGDQYQAILRDIKDRIPHKSLLP